MTVAVITGTAGPDPTHIPLDPEAGLTPYDISFANATDLHTIDQSRLRKRRGRLHPAELQHLKSAVHDGAVYLHQGETYVVRIYLGL